MVDGQVLADDVALRERVLNPYREQCKYLRSIDVRSEEDYYLIAQSTFGKSWTQPATPTVPPLVAIETRTRFWDDTGGKCQGRALLAVTNPPEQAR